jgi:hypothetical protein
MRAGRARRRARGAHRGAGAQHAARQELVPHAAANRRLRRDLRRRHVEQVGEYLAGAGGGGRGWVGGWVGVGWALRRARRVGDDGRGRRRHRGGSSRGGSSRGGGRRTVSGVVKPMPGCASSQACAHSAGVLLVSTTTWPISTSSPSSPRIRLSANCGRRSGRRAGALACGRASLASQSGPPRGAPRRPQAPRHPQLL